VSLHGTLETFALPDVLALLAATKKSGELRVVGGATDGRVWFDAGAVVGSEVGRAVTFVDAVFELLRLESGKFSFDAEKAAPAPGEPAAIEPLLAEAQARLAEWKSIEAVIPSLDHGVKLVPEVRDPHVMVTGEQWRALVGVASAPSVTAVVERLGVGEFDACRTLKGLVEAGLVRVEERAVPATPVTAAPVAPSPAPPMAPPAPEKPKIQALTSTPAASAEALEEPPAPVAAPAPLPEHAPVPEAVPLPEPAGEADELVRQVAALDVPADTPEPTEPDAPATPKPATEGEEPINRGLLLKFLSSVRT
jgi:hypothetical protein